MSTLSTTNIKHPSSASNNIVLDSSGRVLYGTSSALGHKVEIADALQADANLSYSLAIYGNNTAATGNSSQIFLGALNGGTNRGCAIASIITANANAHEMAFKVSGPSATPTERMRLDSSGNLKFNSGYGSVATAYGCRAWVTFRDSSGTPTIAEDGNVSTIGDNGTGDYTINFSTAMPDTNYCVVGTLGADGTTFGVSALGGYMLKAFNTGSIRVLAGYQTMTANDWQHNCIAVFR